MLEIKPNNSTTYRKKQLEELSLYVNYHKEGNKFIIDNIIEYPVITLNDILKTKNSKYIKLLSNIILEYLYNNPEDMQEIPLTKLFTILGITNDNYKHCNNYRKELSQLYEVQMASIYYFYSNTRNEFKTVIERCLTNLRSRSVLNWYRCIMIADDTGVHKADVKTEKLILNTQRKAMLKLKVNNMYEVMKDKKTRKEFNDIIKAELEFNYYYAYDIVVGDIAIQIEYDNVQQHKKDINNLIMDKTESIFSKNFFESFKDEYELLSNLLINTDYNDSILEDLQDKREENNSQYNKEIEELKRQTKNKVNDIKDKYIDTYK